MKITRRSFLKISGATAAGTVMGGLGFDLSPVESYAQELRIKGAKETTTVCCYCSVGCGIIVHTDAQGKVINTEGDPDHPTSEGGLCAKGMSLYQLVTNKDRLTKVLYRAPNSAKWEAKSWDWAFSEIAKRIKKSRDGSFVQKNDKDQVVNRTNGIAGIGCAHVNNEEGWLYQKFLRALGLVYIEFEARL
jgi:formate dehydrogenase major subunit